MLDEKLYWTIVYSRWIDPKNWPKTKKIFFGSMPAGVMQIAPSIVRTMIKKQLYAQGTGRHSQTEIYQIGNSCLQALSDYLAEKDYLQGDQPTRIDACGFSYVTSGNQSTV